jgi:preprotein translocase subunit SecA
MSETNDSHEVKRLIDMATRQKHITLLTRVFGRGIDFVVEEKIVKIAGGVHIIQTFVSGDESESIQIEGRTARQGEKGSF